MARYPASGPTGSAVSSSLTGCRDERARGAPVVVMNAPFSPRCGHRRAARVGYADEFAFSAAFRREVGDPPGIYRAGPGG
jgi:hypothetical protein